MESNSTDVLAVIPARYGSTRFPGKPLALIKGEPMIWHVYKRAVQAVGAGNVAVATDDDRIYRAVTSRGGHAVMSSAGIDCGTSRCADALTKLDRTPRVVINLQGDEPLIDPADIHRLVTCMEDESVEIATLARVFNPSEGFDTLFNPNNPKVTMDSQGYALYFSRSIIPYVRDHEWREWINATTFHIHVGTYAFRPQTLMNLVALPPSPLEQAEKLEQLRWLEAGYKIKIAITRNCPVSIDTPRDLQQLSAIIK